MGIIIEVELDGPREMMYKEMSSLVGEEQLHEIIDNHMNDVITYLYDTKEQ